MPQIISDCPRCKATRTTFDVLADNRVGVRHGWMVLHEAFCVCRHCRKGTIFIVAPKTSGVPAPMGHTASLNDFFTVESYVSLKDVGVSSPPDHLPAEIESAFREGATAVAVGIPNAAAAMFRLCVDHATKSRVPTDDAEGISTHIRRNLTPRLEWLFKTGRLPRDLQDLSTCIKNDGNDGAHDGTLTLAEAEDLQDFAFALLERLYTEPKRVELAVQRRGERHKPKG
jgi:hypothetical protein